MSDLADDLLAGLAGRPARDRAAITAFAGQVRRAESARARIDSDGVVVEKANGDLVAHPAVEIERSASREIRGWVERRPDLFGSVVTPREDLMPLPPKDHDPVDGDGDDAPPSLEDELARARATRASNT